MRHAALVVAVFASAALPATGETFAAPGGVDVVATDDGFAVLSDGGIGARGYWCGAADYARRALGARGGARIYVAKARPPGLGQRSPVVFTLDPTGLTPRSALVLGASISQPGSNLSVGHAYSFCADYRIIDNGDF